MRRILWLYLVTFNLNFQRIFALLDHYQFKITFDLVEELEVRHCVLIQNDKKEDIIPSFKKFSSKYIPTTYFSHNSLVEYIQRTETIYFHIGLIFKDEELDILENLLRTIYQVSTNVNTRKHFLNRQMSYVKGKGNS